MNILMLGDSWGVPNYNTEFDTPVEAHSQYVLESFGHKVFNYSINGGSMLETIEYAKLAMQNKLDTMDARLQSKLIVTLYNSNTMKLPLPNYKGEKIDWIVFFHTESVRDQLLYHMMPWVKLDELHYIASHMAYRSFKDLIKVCSNPKVAVIGGQAPIDSILYEYVTPNFQIVDWRSDLVGRKLPRCVSFSRHELVNMMYDSLEEKLNTLDLHQKILDSMTDTDIFFDRCHPGPKPHKELSILLDKVFRGEVAQTVRAMDS